MLYGNEWWSFPPQVYKLKEINKTQATEAGKWEKTEALIWSRSRDGLKTDYIALVPSDNSLKTPHSVNASTWVSVMFKEL